MSANLADKKRIKLILTTEITKTCLPSAGGAENTKKKNDKLLRLCDLRAFSFVTLVVKF